MGLVAVLAAVSDENIARIHATPVLLEQLLAVAEGEDERETTEPPPALRPATKPGFWARLFGKDDAPPSRPELASVAKLVLSGAEGISVDLDKAWHGIHYLLTQTEWEGDPPLNFLASGGSSLGEEYADQGPPRLFSAAETRAVQEALCALSDDWLAARFEPVDMMRKSIYPTIWDRDPVDDDTLGYLLAYLGPVRQFLRDASENGLGMLITIG